MEETMEKNIHVAMIFAVVVECDVKVVHWSARSMEEIEHNLLLAVDQEFENQYRMINLDTRQSKDCFISDGVMYLDDILDVHVEDCIKEQESTCAICGTCSCQTGWQDAIYLRIDGESHCIRICNTCKGRLFGK
jgi:hypothetical protein